MTPAPNRNAPFVFFCRLYIALGVISCAIGAYLLNMPASGKVGLVNGHDSSMVTMGAIFVVFGIIRIIVAARRLQRLKG